MVQLLLAISAGLFTLASPAALAQTPSTPDTLPLEDSQPELLPEPLEPSGSTTDVQSLSLTLPELIDLVLAGNRDLQNSRLQRLIERQQLSEAEQKFNPRITPRLSIGLTQDLSSSGVIVSETIDPFGQRTETVLEDSTQLNQSAQVAATLTTRIGTNLSLDIDPLSDTQPFRLEITQPLLRGFGRTVNEASVEQARLSETRNQLTLRQQLINTLTTTINRYTGLIQAQEQVRIQVLALERRQQELVRSQALVEAGRLPRVDLFDAERSVADAQRDLLGAQNDLTQANNELLNLVGTDRPLQFVASAESVQELFAAAEARVTQFELNQLVATAYQQRPDYLQAQLDQQSRQLDVLLAEDGQKLNLDLAGNLDLGNFSETTLGIVATRTFEDPALETQRISSEVRLQQGENRLTQLRESIRNDVTSQLAAVQSNLARVEAARRATANANQQLEVSRERYQRGQIDRFEVTTQEQALVDAQNAELVAAIAFLDSIATLEQTVGITLESWAAQTNSDEIPSSTLP
ncbi:MAG TPA: TolC family protein [Leptolyngbyaceae cyanobacterium]